MFLTYLPPMPARKPRPKDEKPQFERFLETVRQVEASETDEELERAIKKIAPSRSNHHSDSRSDRTSKKSHT